jgi:addiction module HigA family antidote
LPPRPPGAKRRKEPIEATGLSVSALAKATHVAHSRIDEIRHGRPPVPINIALRLGRFFDVDPQWSMNMQARHDLTVQPITDFRLMSFKKK